VVERLLSVSGEDTLTVDVKYRQPWTGKLPARFFILSNELPNFCDASGAIANRFVVLVMTKSFLGKENNRLTIELLTELPDILNWALDGLDSLAKNDRFTEPASSVDAVTALRDLVSPSAAFVRDHCIVHPDRKALVSTLFERWRAWCEDNGHRPGSVQTFGRNLRAVVPGLRVERPWIDKAANKRGPRKYLGLSFNEAEAHNGGDRGPQAVPTPDMADSEDGDRWGPQAPHCGLNTTAPGRLVCRATSADVPIDPPCMGFADLAGPSSG